MRKLRVNTSAESAAPPRAETFEAYRWGHLLLVAAVHGEANRRRSLSMDRLATYDFFTAHPFLIFDPGSSAGRRLVREGLEPKSLTYAAAPDRLANRRQRIQADVTALVARGLGDVIAEDGRLVLRLTSPGGEVATTLRSFYAQAVRASATLVVGDLDKLADATLRARAQEWTSHRALMIDVLEAV